VLDGPQGSKTETLEHNVLPRKKKKKRVEKKNSSEQLIARMENFWFLFFVMDSRISTSSLSYYYNS
jgi:hypothetical protein